MTVEMRDVEGGKGDAREPYCAACLLKAQPAYEAAIMELAKAKQANEAATREHKRKAVELLEVEGTGSR